MKQYHFTVIVTEEDGKFTDVYADGDDSGYFPDGNVYDTETEQWSDGDDRVDLDAFEYLAARLAGSRKG